MPRLIPPLSAVAVRRLTRPGFHAVGGVPGLLLQVTETGSRSWVLRAMVNGRRRWIGLGPYPEVSLADARDKARELRAQIRNGTDPIAHRQAAQAKRISFEEAARRCHAVKASEFRNAKHSQNWIGSLERYAFPVIGPMPVDALELADVLRVLNPIWTTKTETASRVRQRIETVLAWATVSGHRKGDNPARWAGNLKEVLPAPSKIKKTRHFPALPWRLAPTFLVDLKARDGAGARALELILYTAARSSEVRMAKWDEFDLDAGIWTVLGERMKANRTHRIPLTAAATRLLNSLPRMHGATEYVFPSSRGTPISDMTISAVTKRLHEKNPEYVDAQSGGVIVPHGFRSTFKDWARSQTSYADEVSELQLAHVNSDATRAAYARDELLTQRRSLMEDWCRFLRA